LRAGASVQAQQQATTAVEQYYASAAQTQSIIERSGSDAALFKFWQDRTNATDQMIASERAAASRRAQDEARYDDRDRDEDLAQRRLQDERRRMAEQDRARLRREVEDRRHLEKLYDDDAVRQRRIAARRQAVHADVYK
jgi:hypothetical protein